MAVKIYIQQQQQQQQQSAVPVKINKALTFLPFPVDAFHRINFLIHQQTGPASQTANKNDFQQLINQSRRRWRQ